MECDGIQGADCDSWSRYLGDREISVCTIICSSNVPVGFNYIKRETGLHQEILSRVLKRLLFTHNIERKDSKYWRRCVPGQ